jgi:hypothetical protein
MLHTKTHKLDLHFALVHDVDETIELLSLQNVDRIRSLFWPSFNRNISTCIRLLLFRLFNIGSCFFKVSQEIFNAEVVDTKSTIIDIRNYFDKLLNYNLRLRVRKITVHQIFVGLVRLSAETWLT